MDDCDDADIYNDLPDFRYDETIDKLNDIIAKLEAENEELHSQLTEMKKEKEVLEKNCCVLSTNITSLLKTAKFEIQRKDKTIDDLRQQLRDAGRRRSNFGVKRHFESTTNNNQSSELKNTSKRDGPTYEPAYKKQKITESDKHTNSVPRNEDANSGNSSFLKPPSKTAHVSQKENVPLTSNQTISEELSVITKIPAPSLPVIDCPTVFSARMYQRLYNKNIAKTVTLPSEPAIPLSDIERPNRLPGETAKVDDQPKRAIESDKTESKTSEEILKRPCPSFSQQPLIPSTESVSENLSTTTVEHDSTVRCSEVNPRLVNGTVSDKSVTDEVPPPPSANCQVGNTESGNAKALVQPSTVSTDLKKSQGLSLVTKKWFPLPKNKRDIVNTNCHSKVTPNVKGKSGSKNMFVPISNAWNCLKPPPPEVSSKSELTGGAVESTCPEVTGVTAEVTGVTAEVTGVTAELTVKIDDDRLNDKRNLALDMFGSPVKWADDCSSDSIKFDVSRAVKRKKNMFSMFGSPYKNGDSCLSEPSNFVLPPGAYEDSCSTNQPPEKVSPRHTKRCHPSLPDLSSKEKSSESTSISNDRDDAKRDVSLPPPARAIEKKSVFSPVRDSKTATSPPGITLDDRSSTGICFPFKPAIKYEDSVLGQFDDTAQFVSALAKVDTKISPFSTPLKSQNLTTQSLDSEPKMNSPTNNMTSFKEVFQNKILTAASTEMKVVTEITHSKCEEVAITGSHAPASDQESPAASVTSQLVEENGSNIEDVGSSNANTTLVDSSATLSSAKFIHRSNFSSSSVFTMSSDSQSFVDKPVNILQPRKAPRAVNKLSPSPNAFCKDAKLNRRIAIPDAFITEQEERVRKWQKNHMYETTLKCGFSNRIHSPVKNQAKVHSSTSDLKLPSPTKSPSKPSSLSRNQGKTPCKGLETSGVPSRPASPENNCDGLPNSTASFVPERMAGSIDTTVLALNMIRSVVDKCVPLTEVRSNTSNKQDTPVVSKRVEDTRHIKHVTRKSSVTTGSPPVNLVPVKCRENSSAFIDLVSQIKPSVTQTSISKLRVVKAPDDYSSLKPIIKKKLVVRRESDFKRSSALKKPGAVVNDDRTQKRVLQSNCKIIGRKTAPNLHVSSRIDALVTSKTPSETFNSDELVKKVYTHESPGDTPANWTVHPIDLDQSRNIYEVITSSFSSSDPRTLPRPDKPMIENRQVSEEDVKTRRDVEQNLVCPIEFSPNVSVIARTNVESVLINRVKVNSTLPVTSTPFSRKTRTEQTAGKLIPENHAQVSSISNETTSGTPTKIPVVRRSGRSALKLVDAPVPREMRTRGRKHVETRKESPPPRFVDEPTKRRGNESSAKSPSTSAAERVTITPGASSKPVVLNHSTPSVASTVQPKLISRKRRNANFSSVTVVHGDRPVIISRKRPPSFTVNNSSN